MFLPNVISFLKELGKLDFIYNQHIASQALSANCAYVAQKLCLFTNLIQGKGG
jgi:hypothetical protein